MDNSQAARHVIRLLPLPLPCPSLTCTAAVPSDRPSGTSREDPGRLTRGLCPLRSASTVTLAEAFLILLNLPPSHPRHLHRASYARGFADIGGRSYRPVNISVPTVEPLLWLWPDSHHSNSRVTLGRHRITRVHSAELGSYGERRQAPFFGLTSRWS